MDGTNQMDDPNWGEKKNLETIFQLEAMIMRYFINGNS
jgi:hypothetical protein